MITPWSSLGNLTVQGIRSPLLLRPPVPRGRALYSLMGADLARNCFRHKGPRVTRRVADVAASPLTDVLPTWEVQKSPRPSGENGVTGDRGLGEDPAVAIGVR